MIYSIQTHGSRKGRDDPAQSGSVLSNSFETVSRPRAHHQENITRQGKRNQQPLAPKGSVRRAPVVPTLVPVKNQSDISILKAAIAELEASLLKESDNVGMFVGVEAMHFKFPSLTSGARMIVGSQSSRPNYIELGDE